MTARSPAFCSRWRTAVDPEGVEVAMIMLTMGLLASLLASPTRVASVETALGAGICGARGQVDCAEATTGLVFDLRGAWHPRPWLGLGAAVLHASLPAEGTASGSLWVAGPEVSLRAALTPDFALEAGFLAGFDRVAGTGGRQTGLGALGLRLGGRYALSRVEVGADYGLVRPRLDDVCVAGSCGQVEAALLHRFSLVVGVAFW